MAGYGKRGGRVQVNMMQYQELVERVEKLEALINVEGRIITRKEVSVIHPKGFIPGKDAKKEMTKQQIMKSLDEKDIKYNIRQKKDVLLKLLKW